MPKDTDPKVFEFPLTGELNTVDDPTTIDKNFQKFQNLRYGDKHPIGVAGMTKINSTALANTHIQNGFHFRKQQPAETHLLVQATDSSDANPKIYQNETAIPSAGDFNAAVLYTEDTAAGIARFSNAQGGNVAMCDGKQACIWGGDELRVPKFIVFESGVTAEYDYSDIINNTLTSATNLATLKHPTHYIASTRPLKGIKYYVETANTAVGTTAIDYWSGSVWTTVGAVTDTTESPAGTTLGQTGSMTFTSTASTAKIKAINGEVYYWYRVTSSALDNTTTLSYVTVDAPFQTLKDIWDGVPRLILSYHIFKSDTFNDNTINVFEEDFSSVNTATFSQIGSLTYGSISTPVFTGSGLDDATSGGTFTGGSAATFTIDIPAGGAAASPDEFRWKKDAGAFSGNIAMTGSAQTLSDGVTITFAATDGHTDTDQWVITCGVEVNYLVAGFTERQMGLDITIVGEAVNTATSTAAIYYWNGDGWTSVGTLDDGTSEGGITFGKSGLITWDSPASNLEFTTRIAKSIPLYYYKIAFSANLSSDVKVDMIAGVPTQVEVGSYKFPVYAKNRLMLCSDQTGHKNSVLISSSDAPDILNGEDTQIIYLGDESELTAGTSLYSRLGSNIYDVTLFFKAGSMFGLTGTSPGFNPYNISETIGCVAPLTLKSGIVIVQKVFKPIAIWQGADDIYLFDNTTPIPIGSSILNFFDKNESASRRLHPDYIDRSVGELDLSKMEYHWLIADGNSTGTLNRELVFDLKRFRWFEIPRTSGKELQSIFNVRDTVGNNYQYGSIDTGYVERLENGTDFDGSDIVQIFKTGDFAPHKGSIMAETELRHVKLIQKTKSNTSNVATCTHYGDSSASGKTVRADGFDPTKSGYSVQDISQSVGLGNHIFHSLEFSLTTNNETEGFEPIYIGGTYKIKRLDTK